MKKEKIADEVELNYDVLDIDQLHLDKHWVEQPRLYLQHAKLLADARRELDRLKSELELTHAELDKEIRTSPEEYDIEKVSEKAIENCILTQKRYLTANAAVIDAKHAVDVYQAFVSALDHRKRALENLVDLHGQSYFATPRATGDNSEAMQEAEQRILRRRGQRPRRSKEEDDE